MQNDFKQVQDIDSSQIWLESSIIEWECYYDLIECYV